MTTDTRQEDEQGTTTSPPTAMARGTNTHPIQGTDLEGEPMSADEMIGSRIEKARGETSQRQLARMMSAGGARWTHLTVAAVESGKRPLRLSEAISLASILSVPVAHLAGEDSVDFPVELAVLRSQIEQIRKVVA